MLINIGLHFAKDCLIDIHEVQIDHFGQRITQKSFDATSSGIDLVHRIEKVAHEYAGSNVILTKEFYERITLGKDGLKGIGFHKFKGQSGEVELFAKLSDEASRQTLKSAA